MAKKQSTKSQAASKTKASSPSAQSKKTTSRTASVTSAKAASSKKAPAADAPKTRAKTATPAAKAAAQSTVKPVAKPSAGKTSAGKSTTTKVSAKAPAKATTTKPAATKSKPVASKPASQLRVPTSSASESPFKVNYSAASSARQDQEPPTLEQLRKVKTGLTKKDLAAFRDLLLQKRAQLSGDMESLRNDAKNIGSSISYEHMADTGSDSYEQELTLGIVESEHHMLREINEALSRIESGIYGVCIETGKPIDRARLEAKPWARYCIEVAREKERSQARRPRI